MKQTIKILLLTIFFFALSNCEVNVKESNAQNLFNGVIQTDELGCTWLIVKAGSTTGGIFAVHHPTCRNGKHRRLI